MAAPGFVRIGNLGILFRAVSKVDLSGAPAPPASGLSPAWLVEYVDTGGVRQRQAINNDGSTSITINQYANVTFDARDSRSESTGCGTAAGAAQLMGYGINHGEALGGTWATSGLSRDVDQGPPIFSRCYTVSGARTVSLYIRDPDGRESTITMTINVVALGDTVDISAGGSWPAWASNTVYGLTSGDYTSRGAVVMSGCTGVRLIKIGGGSDPVVGSYQPEGRGRNHGSVITNRSKDNVLVGIDYANYSEGIVGTDYCGSYGGRCRHFGEGTNYPRDYAWASEAIPGANAVNAANIRRSRGIFIVNGGPIDGASGGLTEYCLIGGGRSMNFAGTVVARTTGTSGGNPMRAYMDSTVLRHMQVYSTTATHHFIKGSLYPCVYHATPSDPWPDDDSFGDYATSRALYLANGAGGAGMWATGPSYFWVCDSLFGGPGTVTPTFIAGWGPQNPLAPTNADGPWYGEDCYESGYTGGYERNRLTFNTSNVLPLGGRDVSHRGNTQLSGSPWSVMTSYNSPRLHPTFNGPYISTARPVHSAL